MEINEAFSAKQPVEFLSPCRVPTHEALQCRRLVRAEVIDREIRLLAPARDERIDELLEDGLLERRAVVNRPGFFASSRSGARQVGPAATPGSRRIHPDPPFTTIGRASGESPQGPPPIPVDTDSCFAACTVIICMNAEASESPLVPAPEPPKTVVGTLRLANASAQTCWVST